MGFFMALFHLTDVALCLGLWQLLDLEGEVCGFIPSTGDSHGAVAL